MFPSSNLHSQWTGSPVEQTRLCSCVLYLYASLFIDCFMDCIQWNKQWTDSFPSLSCIYSCFPSIPCRLQCSSFWKQNMCILCLILVSLTLFFIAPSWSLYVLSDLYQCIDPWFCYSIGRSPSLLPSTVSHYIASCRLSTTQTVFFTLLSHPLRSLSVPSRHPSLNKLTTLLSTILDL